MPTASRVPTVTMNRRVDSKPVPTVFLEACLEPMVNGCVDGLFSGAVGTGLGP
jgi:hypothetical protein